MEILKLKFLKLKFFKTQIFQTQIFEIEYFQNTSISKHFFSYQLNPCYNKAMQQGKGLCSGSQPDGVLVTFCGLATNFENVTTDLATTGEMYDHSS